MTLNSKDVLAALDSFIDLLERNPTRKVSLRFLSTATVTYERKKAQRPTGLPGLTYWRKAARNEADVKPLRKALLAADLSPRVRSYINSLDDERLRIDLLCHIHWDCGQAELQTLQAELDDQLVQFGAKHYGLAATESKKLASRLLLEVLNTTVTASKRRLTYSGMLEIAEDFTHVSLRRRDFDNLLAAAAPVNKEVSAPVATPSEDAVGRRPLREVYPTAWSPWFSKPAHNFGLLIGLATAYPAVYWQLNHVLHHMFGITFDQLKSLSDNRTGGLAFDPYMGVCQLILMAVVLAPIANWSFRKAARSGGDTTRWYLTAAGLVLWPMAVMALLGLTRGLQSPSAAMVAAINGVVSLTLLRANLPKIINTIDEIVGQEKMKFTNDDRRLSYGCRREVEAWFQRLMYVLGIFIVVFCAMMIVLAIIPLSDQYAAAVHPKEKQLLYVLLVSMAAITLTEGIVFGCLPLQRAKEHLDAIILAARR